MVESNRCASCGHQAARPLTAIRPARGRQEPRITASSVDFPDPEAPVTASQRPGSGRRGDPGEDVRPAGPGRGQRLKFDPGPRIRTLATGSSPPESTAPAPARRRNRFCRFVSGLRAPAASSTPASLTRSQDRAERRVLADRRRHGGIRFHERQLQQNHDGGRGGVHGAGQHLGCRPARRWRGRQHRRPATVTAWPSPSAHADRWEAAVAAWSASPMADEHRCRRRRWRAVRPGRPGPRRRRAVPRSGAAVRPGGHPVRQQGGRRRGHQAAASAAAMTAGSAAGSSRPVAVSAAAPTATAVTGGRTTRGSRSRTVSTSSITVPRTLPPCRSRRSDSARRLSESQSRPRSRVRAAKTASCSRSRSAVAQDGPADAEEPHAHDGGEQVQDGRLLAGPDDQPAGQPGQGDGEQRGQRAHARRRAANLAGDRARSSRQEPGRWRCTPVAPAVRLPLPAPVRRRRVPGGPVRATGCPGAAPTTRTAAAAASVAGSAGPLPGVQRRARRSWRRGPPPRDGPRAPGSAGRGPPAGR